MKSIQRKCFSYVPNGCKVCFDAKIPLCIIDTVDKIVWHWHNWTHKNRKVNKERGPEERGIQQEQHIHWLAPTSSNKQQSVMWHKFNNICNMCWMLLRFLFISTAWIVNKKCTSFSSMQRNEMQATPNNQPILSELKVC